MDCAKVIGAKLANPKPIEKYEGFFRVTMLANLLGKLPPLIAIPTTAGTGSEVTCAAVINIEEEQKKIAIVDVGLVPQEVILDPELTVKLPKPVTAATGIDALTHAIESYLSRWHTGYSKRNSLMAIERIFKHLLTCYHHGDNLEAREQTLQASMEAGLAFTRVSVGYVHAIAHQFGGMFHTPHGVANAMLLPHVLDWYLADESDGGRCIQLYFEMAQAAGLASHYQEHSPDDKKRLGRKFVEAVRSMCAEMKIPQTVPQMKASDLNTISVRAAKEAHGELFGGFTQAPVAHAVDLGYPVPKHAGIMELESIASHCLIPEEQAIWESQYKNVQTQHTSKL